MVHDLTVPCKLLVTQIAGCGAGSAMLLDHARCGISSFELDGAAPTITLQQKSAKKSQDSGKVKVFRFRLRIKAGYR